MTGKGIVILMVVAARRGGRRGGRCKGCHCLAWTLLSSRLGFGLGLRCCIFCYGSEIMLHGSYIIPLDGLSALCPTIVKGI